MYVQSPAVDNEHVVGLCGEAHDLSVTEALPPEMNVTDKWRSVVRLCFILLVHLQVT